MKGMLSFIIALSLVFTFTVIFFINVKELLEIGRYAVFLSLIFFLYSVYKFYEVVK